MVRGEDHPAAKLTPEDVIDIRRLSGTKTQAELAARFHLSQTTISRIQLGKIWKHIPQGIRTHHAHATGSRNHLARLTEKDVQEIRARFTGKWGEQKILAKEYGVHRCTIANILRHKRWRHL